MANRGANKLISVGFRKWCYNISGFNQYGLWKDDTRFENDDVIEAVKRLPQKIQDQRAFRITRALQLDACKRVLPKEQWTKFEEDVSYLQPYLDEVVKEREEKEKWEAS